MMYIIYNHDGSVKDKNLVDFIQQGSNDANALLVCIDGYEPTAFSLTGHFVLPNGEITDISSDATSSKEIDGVTYSGVVLALTNVVTALEGLVRMNVVAKENDTDKVLVTMQTFLTVNSGVSPNEIALISQAEYQNLVGQIQRNVSNNETILTFTSEPNVANYQAGQVYAKIHNNNTCQFYVKYNDQWKALSLAGYYTEEEIDALLANKSKVTGETVDNNWTYLTIDGVGHKIATGEERIAAGNGINIERELGTADTISVDTDIVATRTYVTQEIAREISSVYRFQGTKTVAELNLLEVTSAMNNYVYNVSDAGTLSNGSVSVIAGDNVAIVWNESTSTWSWDKLAGTFTVDLSNYVTLDGTQTITGVKTFSNGIEFPGGASIKTTNNNYDIVLWGTTIIFKKSLLTGLNNTFDIGDSTNKWKDLYLSGKIKDGTNEFNADNVFNVINATDIVSNTLTQDQYDLITNGKPTLIKGTYQNLNNPVLVEGGAYSTNAYKAILLGKEATGNSQQIRVISINTSTRVITLETAGAIYIEGNGKVSLTINQLNGRTFPTYPSSPASNQVLACLTDNTLAWLNSAGNLVIYEHLVSVTLTGGFADYTGGIIPDGTSLNCRIRFLNNSSSEINTEAALLNAITSSRLPVSGTVYDSGPLLTGIITTINKIGSTIVHSGYCISGTNDRKQFVIKKDTNATYTVTDTVTQLN